MCVCAHVSEHDNEQVHVNSHWRRKSACRGTFCIILCICICELMRTRCADLSTHLDTYIYIYKIKRLSWTLPFFALQDQFIQLKAVTRRKHWNKSLWSTQIHKKKSVSLRHPQGSRPCPKSLAKVGGRVPLARPNPRHRRPTPARIPCALLWCFFGRDIADGAPSQNYRKKVPRPRLRL